MVDQYTQEQAIRGDLLESCRETQVSELEISLVFLMVESHGVREEGPHQNSGIVSVVPAGSIRKKNSLPQDLNQRPSSLL